jgi:hypothetical protein
MVVMNRDSSETTEDPRVSSVDLTPADFRALRRKSVQPNYRVSSNHASYRLREDAPPKSWGR